MASIGHQVGVGLRSMQLAFWEARSATAPEVLSRMRMDRARALLLAPGEAAQVTTIAKACGFAHLSRFAQAHRQANDEIPSETLSKARLRIWCV
jgi:transcriptional regulator GlxA family with amidase domain